MKKETSKIKLKERVVKYFKEYNILYYLLIAITIFLVTVLITAQARTVMSTDEFVQGKRETELIEDLASLQSKYNELKTEYEHQEGVVEEYQTNSATNNELIANMSKKIDNLSALAGNTNLVGEGIIITLEDGEGIIDPLLRSDNLVHDSDVSAVVNELKAAGAEAISVNGNRIIATSSIRCVGPVILINEIKVAAPFEIKAIGNSLYLESAINIKNGIADLLKQIGIGVKVSNHKEIKIEKYDGTINFKYANINE